MVFLVVGVSTGGGYMTYQTVRWMIHICRYCYRCGGDFITACMNKFDADPPFL
jgi:hypothetical protein